MGLVLLQVMQKRGVACICVAEPRRPLLIAMLSHIPSGHRPEHSATSAKDPTMNGDALGMDPWARSSSSADKQLAFRVTQLLQEAEIRELKALCGRCLYHTITTAVALRVRRQRSVQCCRCGHRDFDEEAFLAWQMSPPWC